VRCAADERGDGGVLFGVSQVVGAVEGEVAQGGKLGLDPVQPAGAGRLEHQLVEPPGAQGLEQVEELAVAFAAPDPVVDLPSGQVECGEHVHHALP
jgi:hypothetical protein